jgi:hypothetical protein
VLLSSLKSSTVFLSRRRLTVRTRSVFGAAHLHSVEFEPIAGNDPASLLACIEGLPRQSFGAKVSLVLSDSYFLPTVLSDVPAFDGDDERNNYLSYRYEELFGIPSGTKLSFADWHALASPLTLCCAAPASLVNGLELAFERQGACVVSLRPRAEVALRTLGATLPASGWLASHDEDGLTLYGWGTRGFHRAVSIPAAPTTPDALRRAIAAEVSLCVHQDIAADGRDVVYVCSSVWPEMACDDLPVGLTDWSAMLPPPNDGVDGVDRLMVGALDA